jgi:cytochrome c-type biogenesis protein CcmH/NrfF
VSALAWWLIPVGATVLAVLAVTLRSRPSRPTTTEDSMARLQRMQQAMERPMPGGNPTDPRPRPDDETS